MGKKSREETKANNVVSKYFDFQECTTVIVITKEHDTQCISRYGSLTGLPQFKAREMWDVLRPHWELHLDQLYKNQSWIKKQHQWLMVGDNFAQIFIEIFDISPLLLASRQSIFKRQTNMRNVDYAIQFCITQKLNIY